jgi:hypothetical protein
MGVGPTRYSVRGCELKTMIGLLFFLVDLAVLVLGALLIGTGVGLLGSGSGEGGIRLVVKEIGEITGINGQLVVFIAGVLLVLAALGYALKAYKEAAQFEGGFKDTVRHFAPMGP